jgi:hypothetical protein
MKQLVLRRVACCCLLLSIKDEWRLQDEYLIFCYLLPSTEQ